MGDSYSTYFPCQSFSLAQKLLFAHTEAGDLTGFIDNYFDTTVGSKTDAASYLRIASALHRIDNRRISGIKN